MKLRIARKVLKTPNRYNRSTRQRAQHRLLRDLARHARTATHMPAVTWMAIMSGGRPQLAYDMHHWTYWMILANLAGAPSLRHVRYHRVGRLTISTIMLGTDMAFGDGPPLWFETMILGHGRDDYEFQRRYTTREEAIEGHRNAFLIAASIATSFGMKETEKAFTPILKAMVAAETDQ